jgi:hypothetical protein
VSSQRCCLTFDKLLRHSVCLCTATIRNASPDCFWLSLPTHVHQPPCSALPPPGHHGLCLWSSLAGEDEADVGKSVSTTCIYPHDPFIVCAVLRWYQETACTIRLLLGATSATRSLLYRHQARAALPTGGACMCVVLSGCEPFMWTFWRAQTRVHWPLPRQVSWHATWARLCGTGARFPCVQHKQAGQQRP